MYGIIYKIKNRVNSKVYIGQTIRSLEERLGEHLRKKKSLVSKAFRKYGIDNFTIEEIDNADSIDKLNDKEHYWIDFYDCIAPKGYNQCEGGGNTWGYHHSEEAKLKMSIGHKGKKCGVENSFYGKTHSDETKQRFSELRKGFKHFSPEQLERFRKAHHHKPVVCVETGETFESASAAALFYNVSPTNITAALKGRHKTSAKCHWRYADE